MSVGTEAKTDTNPSTYQQNKDTGRWIFGGTARKNANRLF